MKREVVFHKRAAKYLRRMPKDRQTEIRDALREVAELDDVVAIALPFGEYLPLSGRKKDVPIFLPRLPPE